MNPSAVKPCAQGVESPRMKCAQPGHSGALAGSSPVTHNRVPHLSTCYRLPETGAGIGSAPVVHTNPLSS